MQGESQFYPHLQFTGTQLRFELRDDGSMVGHMGVSALAGLLSLPICSRGDDGMIDLIGVFYDLKRFADAAPDPLTGENTAISAPILSRRCPHSMLTKTEHSWLTQLGWALNSAARQSVSIQACGSSNEF